MKTIRWDFGEWYFWSIWLAALHIVEVSLTCQLRPNKRLCSKNRQLGMKLYCVHLVLGNSRIVNLYFLSRAYAWAVAQLLWAFESQLQGQKLSCSGNGGKYSDMVRVFFSFFNENSCSSHLLLTLCPSEVSLNTVPSLAWNFRSLVHMNLWSLWKKVQNIKIRGPFVTKLVAKCDQSL